MRDSRRSLPEIVDEMTDVTDVSEAEVRNENAFVSHIAAAIVKAEAERRDGLAVLRLPS